MKNWSGHINWTPKKIEYPENEERIQEIIKHAISQNKKVRIIGTGHSFVPLCKTDQVLISLDQYQGIISCNKDKHTAIVKAGTKLKLLGQLLHEQGMAQENLGDIDAQSIAGSIGTGTHGTGTAFGNLSTQVLSLRFINGKGEIIECSEENNREIFKAAQISLGSLGIITQITLQCVPSYKLELVKSKDTLDNTLKDLAKLNANNRNFEFYWMPFTEIVQHKISNISEAPTNKVGLINHLNEVVVENAFFKLLCETGNIFPNSSSSISSLIANLMTKETKVSNSHQVYSTPRYVRFNEMEYNVPMDAYPSVKKDMVAMFNKKKYKIMFPIENRFVKRDDIYLSPAYERDSAYIACHVYNKKDFEPYFKDMEEIFISYGGRPHWGKMHTRTNEYFRGIYPKWEDFKKVMEEQDPQQLFLNDYLQDIFYGE